MMLLNCHRLNICKVPRIKMQTRRHAALAGMLCGIIIRRVEETCFANMSMI
jgi:hypothetical protein